MDIVNVIANTGGTLGLAVFAIWMLNRVWELRVEEAKRNAECEQQRADRLREALDRNTTAMTRLVEIVERLEKR
jgi:hypothetical protein